MNDYYNNHAINKPCASTVKAAIESLERFMESEEGEPSFKVSDLTPERIERYKKQDLSPNTLQTYLKYLRAGLSRAVKMGKLTTAPHIEVFKKFELNGPRRAYISPDMMAEALDYASGQLYDFLIFGIGTIARTNTILDYHTSQTDFTNRLIDLNQPNRRQTTKYRPVIGLNDFMAEKLKDREGHFVSWRGRKITRIDKTFNTMKKDLGWAAEYHGKTVRHSVAKTIRNRKEWNVNPWELAGHMGHVAVEMTETYAQYQPDPDGTVAKAICNYVAELERKCGFTLT